MSMSRSVMLKPAEPSGKPHRGPIEPWHMAAKPYHTFPSPAMEPLRRIPMPFRRSEEGRSDSRLVAQTGSGIATEDR